MTSKGFAWRRVINRTARLLWSQGEVCKAHLLFREVIEDARSNEVDDDMTEPTQAERYRRIKHAQGLQLTSEGNHDEARRCFQSVWDSAKREVRLTTDNESLIADHGTDDKPEGAF